MVNKRRTAKDSTELKKKILSDFHSGLRKEDIAEKNNVSLSWVSRVCSNGNQKLQLTDEQNINIINDYNSGLSIKKIAEFYGVSEPTVKSRIRNTERYRANKKKLLTDDQKYFIISKYKENLKVKEIAKLAGVHEGTARRILKENGVYSVNSICKKFNKFELDLRTVLPRESFPPIDFFELKPEHRERLEELRKAKMRRWKEIYCK